MSDRPADADDLRDELIQAIHEIARYWANLPDIDPASSRPLTIRGRERRRSGKGDGVRG